MTFWRLHLDGCLGTGRKCYATQDQHFQQSMGFPESKPLTNVEEQQSHIARYDKVRTEIVGGLNNL